MLLRNDLLPLIGQSLLSISSIISLLIYLTGKDSLKKYDWLNRLPAWLRTVVICGMLGVVVAVVVSFSNKTTDGTFITNNNNTVIQLPDSSRAGARMGQGNGQLATGIKPLPGKDAANSEQTFNKTSMPVNHRSESDQRPSRSGNKTAAFAAMNNSGTANEGGKRPAAGSGKPLAATRTRFNGVIINVRVNNEPDDELSGILAELYQGAGIATLTGVHPNMDAATAINGRLTVTKATGEKPPDGIDAIPYRAELAIQLYSRNNNTLCNTLTYKTEFYLAPGYSLPALIKQQFRTLINRLRVIHPLPQCPDI